MLTTDPVKVNYMLNPIGITGEPQFGWIIKSDRKNVIQKTYRLQIASDGNFNNMVYDSGVIESGCSAHVRAAGISLSSNSRYYTRAQASDAFETSDWSPASTFTTALLHNSEWCGSFISAETSQDASNSKGTCLRQSFSAKPGIAYALLHSTALGLYKLYINGKKVGGDELAPGWTSYRKHLVYQTYEVTDLLCEGENSIGAMLGAGWYKGLMGFNGLRNNYGDRTAFLCQLEITYSDGTRELIYTDESWKASDAPILFSEIYDGETYDARLEKDGWNSPGFDTSGWRSVHMVEYDKGVLVSQPGSRVAQIETLPVKKVITTPEGDTVLDFGQNLTGWVKFKVRGHAGDKVILNHFEVLDSKGNVYLDNLRSARQTVSYTLKGGDVEIFHPSFTFHGFQYVKVASYPGEIRPKNFEAVVVHSDMNPTGFFECSNADLNQLQHNILWGLKSNFLDIPTDCPQRNERLGWTGDAQIFCRTASYLMDTYGFFSKWLKDVEADQTPEGGVPHVVPDLLAEKDSDDWLVSQGTHSAAAWADVSVILPWTLYLVYGDTEILEKQYSSMKAWIDFMHSHSEGPLWSYRLQFGDWVALDAKEGSYFGATPNDLTCSAYYAYSTGIFSKIAGILGRHEECIKYSTLYREIVEGFQKEFFTRTGRMAARTQTAHILALHFDLVPEEFRQRTIDTLLELLSENDGHLVTGFVGTPYFCHALSKNGHTREAYELLLKDDFPSWLYQVKAGATTIWEHWDGKKPDGTMWSPDMNSFNHYAYGAVGEWLYRAVAGIDTDESFPGHKHSIINPHPGGGLEYVKASYSTIYGGLSVYWRLEGRSVQLEVEIPHNTTASVILENAREVVSDSGILFTPQEGGFSAQIGSGKYSFIYSV